MRLTTVINDEILVKKLQVTNLFEEVTSVSSKEGITGDCIIISEEYIKPDELIEMDFTQEQVVFYLLREDYEVGTMKGLKVICDSKNIVLIPNDYTVERIVEKVTEKYYQSAQENKQNSIVFLSPLSNIGTTSTCLSVAKSLSNHVDSKIGVLLLNAWDKGTHQLNYKGEYLDSIKGRLLNQAIRDKEEFISMFHEEEKDSLYILGGNRYTKLERLYSKEEIQYLINLSMEYFDVVLIDAGSHFDNANMVQALEESSLKFLIVNQQPKAVEKFKEVYQEILYPIGYKRSDFITIINQFIDSKHYSDSKQINDELNMLGISTIPYVNEPLFSELENRTFYDFGEENYNNAIYKITKSIINHASLEEIEEKAPKKKRWFKR